MEPHPVSSNVRHGMTPQQHAMTSRTMQQGGGAPHGGSHIPAGSVRPHTLSTHVYEGGGNMRGPSMNYPRPGDQYAQKSGAMPRAMYNNHPYVSNSNTMQPTNKKHPPGYLGYNSVMSTATTGQMDPSTMPSNMDSWNGGNNMYNTNPTQMPYNNPRGLQPGIAGGMQPAMGMPMQQGQLMPGQAISDAQGSMMSYGAAPNSHQQHYWGEDSSYVHPVRPPQHHLPPGHAPGSHGSTGPGSMISQPSHCSPIDNMHPQSDPGAMNNMQHHNMMSPGNMTPGHQNMGQVHQNLSQGHQSIPHGHQNMPPGHMASGPRQPSGMPSDFGQYRQQHPGAMMGPHASQGMAMHAGANMGGRAPYPMGSGGGNNAMLNHHPHPNHPISNRPMVQQYPSTVSIKSPLLSQALGHRHPTTYHPTGVQHGQNFPPIAPQHMGPHGNDMLATRLPSTDSVNMLAESAVSSVPFDEGIVSTLPAINPLDDEESSLTDSPMSNRIDSDDQGLLGAGKTDDDATPGPSGPAVGSGVGNIRTSTSTAMPPIAHVPPWPANTSTTSTAIHTTATNVPIDTVLSASALPVSGLSASVPQVQQLDTNVVAPTTTAQQLSLPTNTTTLPPCVSRSSSMTLNITCTSIVTPSASSQSNQVSTTYSATMNNVLPLNERVNSRQGQEDVSRPMPAPVTTVVTCTMLVTAKSTTTNAVHLTTVVTSADSSGLNITSALTNTTNSANNAVMCHSIQPQSKFSTNVVTVSVPFSWKRVVEAGAVVYYSPSSVRLLNCQEIKQYLQQDGTCKCGLECPVIVGKAFNFDPQVASRQWNTKDLRHSEDLIKLCSHKRKILAMAALHDTTSLLSTNTSNRDLSRDLTSNTHNLLASMKCNNNKNAPKQKKNNKGKRRKKSGLDFDDILTPQMTQQLEKATYNFDPQDIPFDLDKNSASKLLMERNSNLNQQLTVMNVMKSEQNQQSHQEVLSAATLPNLHLDDKFSKAFQDINDDDGMSMNSADLSQVNVKDMVGYNDAASIKTDGSEDMHLDDIKPEGFPPVSDSPRYELNTSVEHMRQYSQHHHHNLVDGGVIPDGGAMPDAMATKPGVNPPMVPMHVQTNFNQQQQSYPHQQGGGMGGMHAQTNFNHQTQHQGYPPHQQMHGNIMMVPPHAGPHSGPVGPHAGPAGGPHVGHLVGPHGYVPEHGPPPEFPGHPGLMEPPRPPAKKRQRRKKKQTHLPGPPSALLDRSGMACPNVDVRQMNASNFDGSQKPISFSDNPTAFIQQQMAMGGQSGPAKGAMYTGSGSSCLTDQAASPTCRSPNSSCSSHGPISPVRMPEQHSPGLHGQKISPSSAQYSQPYPSHCAGMLPGAGSNNSRAHSPYGGLQHSPSISPHRQSPHYPPHGGTNPGSIPPSGSQISPVHHRQGVSPGFSHSPHPPCSPGNTPSPGALVSGQHPPPHGPQIGPQLPGNWPNSISHPGTPSPRFQQPYHHAGTGVGGGNMKHELEQAVCDISVSTASLSGHGDDVLKPCDNYNVKCTDGDSKHAVSSDLGVNYDPYRFNDSVHDKTELRPGSEHLSKKTGLSSTHRIHSTLGEPLKSLPPSLLGESHILSPHKLSVGQPLKGTPISSQTQRVSSHTVKKQPQEFHKLSSTQSLEQALDGILPSSKKKNQPMMLPVVKTGFNLASVVAHVKPKTDLLPTESIEKSSKVAEAETPALDSRQRPFDDTVPEPSPNSDVDEDNVESQDDPLETFDDDDDSLGEHPIQMVQKLITGLESSETETSPKVEQWKDSRKSAEANVKDESPLESSPCPRIPKLDTTTKVSPNKLDTPLGALNAAAEVAISVSKLEIERAKNKRKQIVESENSPSKKLKLETEIIAESNTEGTTTAETTTETIKDVSTALPSADTVGKSETLPEDCKKMSVSEMDEQVNNVKLSDILALHENHSENSSDTVENIPATQLDEDSCDSTIDKDSMSSDKTINTTAVNDISDFTNPTDTTDSTEAEEKTDLKKGGSSTAGDPVHEKESCNDDHWKQSSSTGTTKSNEHVVVSGTKDTDHVKRTPVTPEKLADKPIKVDETSAPGKSSIKHSTELQETFLSPVKTPPSLFNLPGSICTTKTQQSIHSPVRSHIKVSAGSLTPSKSHETDEKRSTVMKSPKAHVKLPSTMVSPTKPSEKLSPTKLITTPPKMSCTAKTSERLPNSPGHAQVPGKPCNGPKTPMSAEKSFFADETPEISTSTPKIPDMLPGTPKTPKQLPAIPRTPEKSPTTPKTPEKLLSISKTSERLPGTPKTPERLPGTPKTPERLPGTPKTPERLPGTPKTPERLPGTPKTPERLLDTSKTPEKAAVFSNTFIKHSIQAVMAEQTPPQKSPSASSSPKAAKLPQPKSSPQLPDNIASEKLSTTPKSAEKTTKQKLSEMVATRQQRPHDAGGSKPYEHAPEKKIPERKHSTSSIDSANKSPASERSSTKSPSHRRSSKNRSNSRSSDRSSLDSRTPEKSVASRKEAENMAMMQMVNAYDVSTLGPCESDSTPSTSSTSTAAVLDPASMMDPAMAALLASGQMLDPSAELTEQQQQLLLAQQQLMLQQMQYASMQNSAAMYAGLPDLQAMASQLLASQGGQEMSPEIVQQLQQLQQLQQMQMQLFSGTMLPDGMIGPDGMPTVPQSTSPGATGKAAAKDKGKKKRRSRARKSQTPTIADMLHTQVPGGLASGMSSGMATAGMSNPQQLVMTSMLPVMNPALAGQMMASQQMLYLPDGMQMMTPSGGNMDPASIDPAMYAQMSMENLAAMGLVQMPEESGDQLDMNTAKSVAEVKQPKSSAHSTSATETSATPKKKESEQSTKQIKKEQSKEQSSMVENSDTVLDLSTTSNNSANEPTPAHHKDEDGKPSVVTKGRLSSDDICNAVINAATSGTPVVITNDKKVKENTTKKVENPPRKQNHKKSISAFMNKIANPALNAANALAMAAEKKNKNPKAKSTSPGSSNVAKSSADVKTNKNGDPALDDEESEAFRKETRDFIRKQLLTSSKGPGDSPTKASKSPVAANLGLALTAHSTAASESSSVTSTSTTSSTSSTLAPNSAVTSAASSPTGTTNCLSKGLNRKGFMSKFGMRLEQITASLKVKNRSSKSNQSESTDSSAMDDAKTETEGSTASDRESVASSNDMSQDLDNDVSTVSKRPNGLIDYSDGQFHGSRKRKKISAAPIMNYRPNSAKRRKDMEDILNFQHSEENEKKMAEELSGDHDDAVDMPDINITLPSKPRDSSKVFDIGELVWGPSHGSTMWPGKLVHQDEMKTKLETGKLCIWWFGDHSYSQVSPNTLMTLTEGLEAHHTERQKLRKGRKMNPSLEKAIQEAMLELDRQMSDQSKPTTEEDTPLPEPATMVT